MADVVLKKDFAREVRRVVEQVLRENPGLLRPQQTRRGIPADPTLRLAILEEDIDQGELGDVTIYHGADKGSETTSSITVEAYNRFGDLSEGQECIIAQIDGWEIIAAGCE